MSKRLFSKIGMVQISFTNCRTIWKIVLGAIYQIALQSVKQTYGFLEPCPKIALFLAINVLLVACRLNGDVVEITRVVATAVPPTTVSLPTETAVF
jgi:hypothetical protein